MTAKQKLHHIQVEVESNEQWRKDVLKRRGLSVVDVYTDWAGPCLAMRDRLIRLKLLEGGDDLHLFTANASLIKPLARFNEHCEPTWLILGGGKLVNLYIGCNCPEIIRIVRSELRRELQVLRGKATRKTMPMSKLTPAELRRQARLDAAVKQERDNKEAQRRAQVRAVRTKAYRRLAEALRRVTVVLFLPHALDDDGQLPTVAESLKSQWRDMGFGVRRTARVNITEEIADDIFWERRLPQHRELVESLRAGYSIALLVERQRAQSQGDSEEEEEADPGARGDAPVHHDEEEEEGEEEELELGQIEQIIAESIYGFFPASPGTEGSSQQDSSPSEFFSPVGPATPDMGVVGDQFRLSTSSWLRQSATPQLSGQHIFGHEDEQDEDSLWRYGEGSLGDLDPGGKEMRPVVDSAAAMLLKRDKVTLPGIWTPLTPLGKAAAVRALFADITASIYEEEPIPPPPPTASVVVFRAFRRNNAWRAIRNFPGEVLHYGFFTEDKQRLAGTIEQYEQLKVKEPRDKLVVAVASTRSAPLLALAEIGASYISPNASIAKNDLEEYFGSSVREAEPRQAPQLSEDEDTASLRPRTAPADLTALPHESIKGAEQEQREFEPPLLENTQLSEERPLSKQEGLVRGASLQRVMSVTRVQSVARISLSEQEKINVTESDVNEGDISSITLEGNLGTSLISMGLSSSEVLEVQDESSEVITLKQSSTFKYEDTEDLD